MGDLGLKRCMAIECCTQDSDPNQTPCIDHSGRRGGCHMRLIPCWYRLVAITLVWQSTSPCVVVDARVSPSFQ